MSRPSNSAPSPSATARKSQRVHVAAEVMLRRAGHRGYRVRIFDVSPHGCKAEFVERPELEEHVWVKFDGLDSIEAAVCWVRGFDVGLEFENPIHPAVFSMVVARLAK